MGSEVQRYKAGDKVLVIDHYPRGCTDKTAWYKPGDVITLATTLTTTSSYWLIVGRRSNGIFEKHFRRLTKLHKALM